MQVKSIADSAILSTFIKLPFDLKTFILSNFEWPLNTGITVFQECLCPADLKSQLLKTLSETVYYDEIAMGFTRMQTDCKDFIASLKQQGLSMDNIIPPG